jgi:uncharacterized membrane protein YobD (UPF0266 family)
MIMIMIMNPVTSGASSSPLISAIAATAVYILIVQNLTDIYGNRDMKYAKTHVLNARASDESICPLYDRRLSA